MEHLEHDKERSFYKKKAYELNSYEQGGTTTI